MAVSKCAADTDLDRVESSLRARSSVWIERWSPEPKVRGSNPLGRISKAASKWPFFFWFGTEFFINLRTKIRGQKLRSGAKLVKRLLHELRRANNVIPVTVVIVFVRGYHALVRKLNGSK